MKKFKCSFLEKLFYTPLLSWSTFHQNLLPKGCTFFCMLRNVRAFISNKLQLSIQTNVEVMASFLKVSHIRARSTLERHTICFFCHAPFPCPLLLVFLSQDCFSSLFSNYCYELRDLPPANPLGLLVGSYLIFYFSFLNKIIFQQLILICIPGRFDR